MADRPTTERQVALYALNGWACYATRKIELDDIARLHAELQAINGVEDESQPVRQDETPTPQCCGQFSECGTHEPDCEQHPVNQREEPDHDLR